MGFLKFLKREKKQDLTSLDLPPEPPKMQGFDDNLPDIPDFPEMSAHDSDNNGSDFKFDFPESKNKDFGDDFDMGAHPNEEKMPEMPEFPDMGKKAPPIMPAQMPILPEMEKRASSAMPTSMPAFAPVPSAIPPPQAEDFNWKEEPQEEVTPMPEPSYERPRKLFHHERKSLSMQGRKEVYVRVDKFKMALDGIGMIRNSLKKSDEALLKLESIKNDKDRSFDKAKSSLEDLQKKIIFIDKTLFKGE